MEIRLKEYSSVIVMCVFVALEMELIIVIMLVF